MSTISTHSPVSTTQASRSEAPASANRAASRAELIVSQPVSGNSGNVPDSVSMLRGASALSTNNSINRVLSDIVGPRAESGNSAAGMLLFSNPTGDDPAAKFRSATKVPLEGYDQSKLDNPEHKTPKYLFGRVAQGFSLDSLGGDKAKAQELLTAMVPDLKKAGLEVVSVKGDRIQVKTELGYEWVDVVRASAAAKGEQGWQWGSEGKGTPKPTKDFQEFCDLTGIGGTPASGATPAGGAAAGGTVAAGGAAAGGTAAAGGASPAGPKFTPLGNQLDSAKVMSVLEKYSVDDIEKAVADKDLQDAYPGVKLIPHPKRLDKLQFPNGAVVDVVVGAGAPGAKWGWMPEN
jgi:hypothetical protein